MNELEILKMVPAYLVPAAIVLYYSSKSLSKRDADFKEVAVAFAERVERMSQEHSAHIAAMMEDYRADVKESQASQKEVITDYIGITRETVVAVKALESGVRELRDHILGLGRGRVSRKDGTEGTRPAGGPGLGR
ncbi:hypothetical protein [Paludisphaera mucosa]|uniref:Uncharacterized protein n=1 Tax=Paludisphaera mucosa TaxID=3030827 RepID=A0ABT6F4N9_9BACT|nr:hypothetical protein [Paludisphaera mucosa]MDG3002547.1 hypothetical protein [Paludisphaera mucosa]